MDPCRYFSTAAPTGLASPDSFETSGAVPVFAALTLLLTFAGLVGAVLFSGTPVRDDVGILLDCGRLILHGWIPYVDYVEMNPPLAHYINVIPVYLAGQLHVEIPTAFYIFVLTFAVYSAAALIYLLSKLTPVFSLSSRLVLAAMCLLFSLWVFRTGEFGQKDHLFALAYIPWLYCREIRHGGGTIPRWVGIVVGLVGGPFFLLKPHFCLLVAFVEAWLLFISRRFSTLWSPENLVLACLVLGYAVHFCLVPSEMRDALFHRWLPFIIANYDVYNHTLSEIARQFSTKFLLLQILVILAALALMARSRLPNNWKFQLHGLLASTLAAWGIFFMQHKGWTYHLLPAISIETLLAGTLAVILVEWERAVSVFHRASHAIRTVMFLVLCFSLSLLSLGMDHSILASAKGSDPVNDFVRLIDRRVAADERVAFISTSVAPAYPTLIYAKRLPGTRFLQAFPIAYLYKGAKPRANGTPPYHSPSQVTPEERRFLDELASDTLKSRPKLVFIESDHDCQACPTGFQIDKYLAAEGWLQTYMRNYTFMRTLHGFAVYIRTD